MPKLKERGGTMTADPIPWSDAITAYDEANLVTYLRLLDAQAAGAADAEICCVIFDLAADAEICCVIFDLDIQTDRERATRILRDHLKRARWMTERGYMHLLRSDH